MAKTKIPFVKEFYNESDFDVLGFHDCHIHGISWNDDTFLFLLKLDYIVEWVNPSHDNQNFRFWICPAELVFKNVDDVEVVLRWQNLRMDCCIDNLLRQEFRLTPNGTKQWNWVFDLSEPAGSISLWATGFELKMKGSPVLSDTQRFQIG